jgi:glycerol uptake facilitator-like aquaporin
VPGFIAAQVIGGTLAVALAKVLYPQITAEQAARIVIPHPHRNAGPPSAGPAARDAGATSPAERPVR